MARCVLCQRERGIVSTTPSRLRVCAVCARRIGAFILSASHATLQRIWDCGSSPSPAMRGMPGEHVELDDAVTHASLAIAYCEMGLTQEALHEAGLALRSAGDTGDVATLALAALEQRLRRTGEAELRRVLYREN